MLADRFQGYRFFVLARNRQQNPPVSKIFQMVLEVNKRLAKAIVAAQVQILPALIPHDPTPESVVQIQNQQLPGAAMERGQRASDVESRFSENLRAKQDFPHIPELLVVGLSPNSLNPFLTGE